MNLRSEHCSDDDLRQLLRGSDESAGETPPLTHLESCGTCQQRLDELAGSREEWADAREALVSDSPSGEELSGTRGAEPPFGWNEDLALRMLSPPVHPEFAGRMGRYDVEGVIGSGGMGIVFKAFDAELNRPVAIKMLSPHLANHGAARRRFEREARAAAAVVHDHVVPIHNVEAEGAAPFLVMPLVPGESLQQRLDRGGPLHIREVLRIAMQTANALAAAHAQGLIHRDVKPSNILLEQGVDRALLTDFGLARAADDATLTHTGHHPGTPQYMSPEQARGDSLDRRSDLFSLGSVMYAMCAGRPPFRAETSYGVLRRITDSEVRPLQEINADIPDWLQRLINRLLSKSPDDRLQSAKETAEILQQCLAFVQQPSQAALPVLLQRGGAAGERRTAKRAFRRSGRALLPVVAVLLLVAVISMLQPPGPPAGNDRLTAETAGATESADSGRSQGSLDSPVPAAPLTEELRSPPQFNGPAEQAAARRQTGTDWIGVQPKFDDLDQDLTRFESLSRPLWDDTMRPDSE